MRKLLLLVPVLVTACEGPTIPPKSVADVYDFRLATTPPSVLRWPSGTQVRVFAQGVPGPREELLSSSLASGVAEWNRHALYGEYALVRAASLREADVLLRWSDEPAPVDMTECPPVLAIAVTTFCLRTDDPTRLRVFPLLPPETGGTVRIVITILGTEAGRPVSVQQLVTHELGHALGIARHSPDPDDLMAAGQPPRVTLSARDIATVRTLYHTAPQVRP